jgi:hypothetical protein
MSEKWNADEVICPNCCHQFRAIPVNVVEKMSELEACIKNQEAQIVGRHQYVGQDFQFRLDRALRRAEAAEETVRRFESGTDRR